MLPSRNVLPSTLNNERDLEDGIVICMFFGVEMRAFIFPFALSHETVTSPHFIGATPLAHLRSREFGAKVIVFDGASYRTPSTSSDSSAVGVQLHAWHMLV